MVQVRENFLPKCTAIMNTLFKALLPPYNGPGKHFFRNTPKESSPLLPELLRSHGDFRQLLLYHSKH
jgi:hypothetical protein